jgi:hypothetical protein
MHRSSKPAAHRDHEVVNLGLSIDFVAEVRRIDDLVLGEVFALIVVDLSCGLRIYSGRLLGERSTP